MVIVTPEHEQLFARRLQDLGSDVPALVKSGQLLFRDAHQTLSEFMVSGQPDWHRFEQVVRAAMRQVHPPDGRDGLRAYGEMVGILWKARQFAAAIRLEQLWNKLLEQSSFSLYCAYAVDIFGKEFDVANLEGVLRTHTHLLPAQPGGTLEDAVNRALDEIFGAKANELRVLIKSNQHPSWAVMPTAESTVLWVRKNMAEQADQIVSRTRYHYELLSRPAGSSA